MTTKAIKLLEAIHKKNEGKQVLILTDKEFEALFNNYYLQYEKSNYTELKARVVTWKFPSLTETQINHILRII